MKPFCHLALLGTLLTLPLLVGADRVQVPVGQQADRDQRETLPDNGMTRTRVETEFGEPEQRHDAVGDPPISSWEYGDFVVYFESDRVLRTVVKHRPRAEAASSDTNGG